MQINDFSKWDSEPYCEVSQSNPLRWMNLRVVDDDIFVPVSYWWKCKDFLNDAVTSLNLKKDFSIYGFKCSYKEFFNDEQEGMWLLLKNVVPEWDGNMEVVNDCLLEQGFDPVEHYLQPDGKQIIYIPDMYCLNTLFISQVTLFIRMANVSSKCNTMQQLADLLGYTDKQYYQACVKKPLGSFPEKLLDYIWYYNDNQKCKHGDAAQSIMTSQMHNCGVVSWGWA